MFVKTHNRGNNNLQDFAQDFFAGIDVADKRVRGVELIRLFGGLQNQMTFPCDLMNTGLVVYTGFPENPLILQVGSTDANDTLTGTGARRVMLYGLDANFKEQFEIVNMAGATFVSTTKTWARCNKAVVIEAGSNQGASGQITIVGGGGIFARILPKENVSRNLIYSVPANKTAFVSDLWFSINRSSGSASNATDRDVDIQFNIRDLNRNVVYRPMVVNITQMQSFEKDCSKTPLIIGSKCDFWVSCINGNGSPIDISGFVGLYVKDNEIA